ncbi:MAG: pilus assembly PilX N-terminal domain-containing protein [bacterium]
MIKKTSKKGVSVYLAILVMSILLAIGIGVTTIILGQARMIRSMGDSVIAFYAADTGIENVLYEDKVRSEQDPPEPLLGFGEEITGNLENGSSYTAEKIAPGGTCDGAYYCIRSIGTFKEVRRAVEVSR